MPFPVEDRFIVAEEGRLGVRFPHSFREFLARSNGGEVEIAEDSWQVAPVFDTSDRKRMGRTASHIAKESAVARGWRGFPATGVAFASNGSGDRLVLLPSANDPSVLSEAVLFWNHETGELEQVAASFGDAVAGAV